MAKKTAPLLPGTADLLHAFGDRLRLARLRRRLSAKHVGERAGMAPMTLRSLERGEPGVTIGAYLAVMQVLGLEKELELLAAMDPVGRELQDARLTPRAKTPAPAPAPVSAPPQSPIRRIPAQAPNPDALALPERSTAPLIENKKLHSPSDNTLNWKVGFASARALANLIIVPSSKKAR
ncbi:transcriptional regulator [Oxalobacteraceae bacterium CAVE-383]|nr:transcriptional regulator [Oxalobacteraceae bacterium CAVE-383]